MTHAKHDGGTSTRFSRRRSPSLRTRVTLAAALVTTLIVLVVGGVVWVEIGNTANRELNGRVDTVSAALQPSISTSNVNTVRQSEQQGVLTTVRFGGAKVLGTDTEIPPEPPGTTDLTINGHRYRVKTVSVLAEGDSPLAGLATVSVAVPLQPTLDQISNQRELLIVVAVAAIAASAILGWLLAGLAVRPLRDLAQRTEKLPVDAGVDSPQRRHLLEVHGAREAEELAAAMNTMLARIDAERARTDDALATARDFASASAHELRTPLTAMRTDLEVLATMDPGPVDRAEIVGDLRHSHQRVLETLAALEALARGNLGGQPREEVDLVDICDLAVTDSRRRHPDVEISLDALAPTPILAYPAGIRMIVTNAITNAVRHGEATRVVTGIRREGRGAVLWVDDNGRGVPPEDRARVFERFARGAAPKQSGSGLGLSLIAQQAELHGGAAELTDSPLGGARLFVRLG